MRILALETSTSKGSVAVYESGQFLFASHFEQPRGRGEALLQTLEQVVPDFGPIKRIAVGTGPGGYNGIRSAIAVVEGLKMAWKVPVIGISSLLAVPCPVERYAVVGDARGNSLFFGTVCGQKLEELSLLPRAEFTERLQAWEGLIYTVAPLPEYPHLKIQAPTAEKLAHLAAVLSEPPDIPLLPLYLKPPYISQN